MIRRIFLSAQSAKSARVNFFPQIWQIEQFFIISENPLICGIKKISAIREIRGKPIFYFLTS